MKEQTIIRGESKQKAAYFVWPGVLLWVMTFLYAGLLYGMNVKSSRYAWSPDSCFMEQKCSFLEFVKAAMGPNTPFISITSLFWSAVLSLLVGICLYVAFRNNEITVSNRRIYGTAAFGTRVQLLLSSVLYGEDGPGHSIKLHLFAGSLLFGGIKNKKEILRNLDASLILREKQRVQIGSRGLSNLKLAAICFLPFVLLFLPILLWGEPSLAKAWESYWGWDDMQAKLNFLSFWLVQQLEQKNNWPISLLYLAFPALLAGGIFFFACSRQKILVTDCRVQGRGGFRAAFDLPLSEIKTVKSGWFHTVTLYHNHGKIRILGLKNREEVLGVLEKSVNQGEAYEAPVKAALKSQTVSNKTLGFFCFLPVLLFVILLTMGIYRNAGFCREMYQSFASIRETHAYPEYLLMWVLVGNLGRWIKAFFWLFLVGIDRFFACRSTSLTLKNGRIQGRSKWGGYLDIGEESLEGVSIGLLGSLILYTDGGKFIFANIKNREEFYVWFSEKFSK